MLYQGKKYKQLIFYIPASRFLSFRATHLAHQSSVFCVSLPLHILALSVLVRATGFLLIVLPGGGRGGDIYKIGRVGRRATYYLTPPPFPNQTVVHVHSQVPPTLLLTSHTVTSSSSPNSSAQSTRCTVRISGVIHY
jgi:hypothetical protein